MGKEFEVISELVVEATPEEVWQAIATGPGIDSWFMGRNEVEPREGGIARMTVDGHFTAESRITAWEPAKRYAITAEPGEDGSFHAMEFLIEGRDQSSTVVRWVHSGILGDSWEWEYDALRKGDPMYFGTLGQYLSHFKGRTAVPVAAWGPQQADEDTVWEGFKRGLGLTGSVEAGDRVRFTLAGRTVEGVVDSALYPGFLGVRTDAALLRFVGGMGSAGVGHHIFADVDRAEAVQEWQSWLNNLFS